MCIKDNLILCVYRDEVILDIVLWPEGACLKKATPVLLFIRYFSLRGTFIHNVGVVFEWRVLVFVWALVRVSVLLNWWVLSVGGTYTPEFAVFVEKGLFTNWYLARMDLHNHPLWLRVSKVPNFHSCRWLPKKRELREIYHSLGVANGIRLDPRKMFPWNLKNANPQDCEPLKFGAIRYQKCLHSMS